MPPQEENGGKEEGDEEKIEKEVKRDERLRKCTRGRKIGIMEEK